MRQSDYALPMVMMTVSMIAMTLLALLFIAADVHAMPYRPSNPAQIVETLPAGSMSFQQRTPPQTMAEALNRANLLIAKAYSSGDPRAIGQAEALLAPYASVQTPEINLIRANIDQSTHRFDQARQALQQILKKIPNQPDSLFMLASINLVQGQFTAARRQCDQLQDASLLVLKMICVAQVDSMTGNLRGSAETISQLMQVNAGLTPEQQRWLDLIAADIALRRDDAAMATQVFRQMDQQSAPALTARADWLLAHQQWEKVRQLLSSHTDNDSLLLRLVISEQQLKDPKAKPHAKILAQRIAIWQQRGEMAHQREQAQFAYIMGDFKQALRLARLNWQRQRETADVVIYAHAALRTSSAPDIKTIKYWMAQTGFEYPLLAKALESDQTVDE